MNLVLILAMLSFTSYPTTQKEIDTIAAYYQLTQEDYSVYSAVINSLYVSEKIRTIVIIDETKERQILQSSFHFDRTYVLITKKEAADLCIQCPDTKFYEKYPGSPGYIKLAQISFNSQLNRASVLIERYCGLLCAEGIYVTLIKTDGVWKVHQKKTSWVS